MLSYMSTHRLKSPQLWIARENIDFHLWQRELLPSITQGSPSFCKTFIPFSDTISLFHPEDTPVSHGARCIPTEEESGFGAHRCRGWERKEEEGQEEVSGRQEKGMDGARRHAVRRGGGWTFHCVVMVVRGSSLHMDSGELSTGSKILFVRGFFFWEHHLWDCSEGCCSLDLFIGAACALQRKNTIERILLHIYSRPFISKCRQNTCLK